MDFCVVYIYMFTNLSSQKYHSISRMSNPMMKMINQTPLSFVITILCLILKSNVVSSAQSLSLTTLAAPLNKDTATSLYTVALDSGDRYLIDFSSTFSWQRCPPRPPFPAVVGCFTTECIQAQYIVPTPSCALSNNPSDPCKCMVSPINPITGSCASAELISRNLSLFWTDGAIPTATAKISTFFSCAPTSLFQSFPRGSVGLASLSSAPLALPAQLSSSFPNVSKKFAMCLPSSDSENGVIFFGNGPYKLRPPTNFDASSLVSYTPLLINPKSPALSIGIKALSVSGHSIPMSPNEGVGLSTVVPYTTLRSGVYNSFVRFFTDAMKGIPRVKNVRPFSVCYNASTIGYGRVGLEVPRIDLEFEGGKNWTVYGANSMKKLGRDRACLAILDGGENAAYNVLVGSFQMEENLVVLDLEQSRFGISSSLYRQGISCGNFKFRE